MFIRFKNYKFYTFLSNCWEAEPAGGIELLRCLPILTNKSLSKFGSISFWAGFCFPQKKIKSLKHLFWWCTFFNFLFMIVFLSTPNCHFFLFSKHSEAINILKWRFLNHFGFGMKTIFLITHFYDIIGDPVFVFFPYWCFLGTKTVENIQKFVKSVNISSIGSKLQLLRFWCKQTKISK